MENYLQPQKDGLLLRESGPWVREKLDYLMRYIEFFETSMRNKWRNRNYIDLFAGPGKCVCRKTGEICLGSPLIALITKYPFTGYHFVDSDPAAMAALRKRCSASSVSDRIHFDTGDANDLVQSIVSRIQGESSLNLAVLDPEGLDLQWNTVAKLAQLKKVDLIIHYSQMGLTRAMPIFVDSAESNTVDRFFGSTDWRGIYQKYQNQEEQFIHRKLIDFYMDRLRSLGYKGAYRDDEVGVEPLMRNEKNAPLYRLLFASKHPLGHDFWQKVTRRDVYGQKRLL